MSKLTVEEIINLVENSEITVEDFAYCDIEKTLPNIGEWEEVDSYGGEGQGDTWYSVKYFPKHDVYIRTDGWYSSYVGVEFYDGYGKEVKPVEKTITVYQ